MVMAMWTEMAMTMIILFSDALQILRDVLATRLLRGALLRSVLDGPVPIIELASGGVLPACGGARVLLPRLPRLMWGAPGPVGHVGCL